MSSSLASLVLVVLAMSIVAVVEALIPLRERSRRAREHLGPNLALTTLNFALNLVLNVALIGALAWADSAGIGLLHAVSLGPLAALAIVLGGLDLATWLAHRSMHAVPAWWRLHAVHHCDPFVDVTTTIRQHPGESLIRYAFLAVAAIGLGATPAAFAAYRLASTLVGLAEHANVRLPRWLDRLAVLVAVTPDMHKVHHSRRPGETDSNFSNLTSLWDRLFGTYTPSARGRDVDYGLDGHDDRQVQSTLGLLALPFRRAPRVEPAE